MANNLPPDIRQTYTDRERAVIAGYLIRKRVGTLQALRSARSIKPDTTDGWAEGSVQYYQDAEAYSRFLLYWIGYQVGKDQNYG